MKKNLFLLFFLLISISVFSQTKSKFEQTKERNNQILNSFSISNFKKNVTSKHFRHEQMLDSVIYFENKKDWITSMRNDYQYYINGLLKEELISGPVYDTKKIIPYYKNNYTYTAFDSLETVISEYYDNTSGEWLKQSLEEYVYEENNYLKELVFYIWNENTQDWVASMKFEIIYDEEYKFTNQITYNFIENVWVYNSKYDFTYNLDDFVTNSTFYMWEIDLEIWIYNDKVDITYDENNNKLETLSSYWDLENEIWVENYKYICVYNIDNTLAEEHYFYFESENWLEYSKVYYSYTDNKLFSTESFYWDYEISQWINDIKTEFYYIEELLDYTINYYQEVQSYKIQYSYDEFDNNISFVGYNWESDAWVESSLNEYILDYNYTIENVASPLWYNQYEYTHALIEESYSTISKDITQMYKTNYYVSDFDVNIKENNFTSLNIYPNPASDYINISSQNTIENINIYNIDGKKIDNIKTNKTNNIIDISNLQQGIYILETISENQVEKSKFIKQ